MSLDKEHGNMLAMFKESLAKGRLGHAYLIVGDPRGNAARLADNILKLLYCANPEKRPCSECDNCRRVERRIHPDVMWVEPVKKSRGILVNQVEEVLKHIFQTTYEGGWKAVVLMNAERMNIEAANKLLKTLEEPSPKSVFLLVSDQPEALLPTIISRCQRVALPDSASVSADALRNAVAEIAGGMTGGLAARLGKAREMAALLQHMRAEAESEAAEWFSRNRVEGEDEADLEQVSLGRMEAEYRERRRQVLRLLLLWQRDILLAACGPDCEQHLYFRSAAEQICRMARGLTCAQALSNVAIVEQMQDYLDLHLSEAMVIERAFLQLSTGRG